MDLAFLQNKLDSPAVRISRTALLAVVVILCAITLRGQSADDGKLIARNPYEFAPYERVKGLEKVATKAEYERAVKDARFQMEELKYSSDGLAVTAYLFKSKDTEAKKFPVIIYNRGGYTVGNIGNDWAVFFHRLASEGFVVLAPLYRESNGAPGKDEVGGADLNDLMNTLPLLRSLEFADTKNLFMYGESRGGMMTFQAARDGYPINAAATLGAFIDFDAVVKSKPEVYSPLVKKIWPDYESRSREIIERRSAARWADRLNVPLLLMQGGADRSLDPAQTLTLAQLLQKSGKSYELIIFNGDNHTLSKNQIERDRRAIAWFRKHMNKN